MFHLMYERIILPNNACILLAYFHFTKVAIHQWFSVAGSCKLFMIICLLCFIRNLEFLGIAQKRVGWRFQYPPKSYYHKYVLYSYFGIVLTTVKTVVMVPVFLLMWIAENTWASTLCTRSSHPQSAEGVLKHWSANRFVGMKKIAFAVVYNADACQSHHTNL